MQIVDEIFPANLNRRIKNGRHILYFDKKTWFLVCNLIFGRFLGVQMELGKNLFFLEIIGWEYMPTPAWNTLYQSPRGIGLIYIIAGVSFWEEIFSQLYLILYEVCLDPLCQFVCGLV